MGQEFPILILWIFFYSYLSFCTGQTFKNGSVCAGYFLFRFPLRSVDHDHLFHFGFYRFIDHGAEIVSMITFKIGRFCSLCGSLTQVVGNVDFIDPLTAGPAQRFIVSAGRTVHD